MLQDACNLRLETDIDKFQQLFQDFLMKYNNTPQINYFVNNYGVNGVICPCTEWGRCYNLGAVCHNLHIERYHASIKKWGLRPNLPLEQTILTLNTINQKFHWKSLRLSSGLATKPSKLQESYSKCHIVQSNNYFIQINNETFELYHINDTNEENECYKIKRNSYTLCDQEKCEAKCKKCPTNCRCAHYFTCTCPQYAFKSLCKHLHIINAYLIQPRPLPGCDHDYVPSQSLHASNWLEEDERADNTSTKCDNNDYYSNENDAILIDKASSLESDNESVPSSDDSLMYKQ